MTGIIGQSFGRYHILEQLGEGGMAVVYKAFDTRLERNVAIKVILPQKQHTEKFIKRFELEAKSLAQLSHPNIVKVIDYGEHEGLPYLVMEYLPGGTLKRKMMDKPIYWQEAAKLLIPIASALGYAHEHKIIHRDIKPSNILITKSGEPMLSDFGIAKILEAEETMDLTGTGVGVGTPEYMSPEQAQGKVVDARSDVYSLGVVLYEMITGRKPYQADTPMAVAFKLASEPLPRPRQFSPGLPDHVEKALIKTLAKDPNNRFQSMSEFIEILNRLAQQKVEVGRRIPKPVVISVIIAFVTLFLGGVWFRVNGSAVWQKETVVATQTSELIPGETPGLNSPTLASQSLAATLGSGSSPSPLQEPGASYYDQFEEASYDGTLNSSLWIPRASNCKITQVDGVLQFVNDASESHQECDLYAGRPTRLQPASQLGAFEVQAMISSDYNKESVATKEMQFRTNDLSGGTWIAMCGLSVAGTGAVEGFMSISFFGDTAASYGEYDNSISLENGFDSWHAVRLEMDATSLATTCLIDGQLIGALVPRDADLLASAGFERAIEAARGPGAFVTSYVDNVLFGTVLDTSPPVRNNNEGTFLVLEDFEDEQVQMPGYSADSNLWQIVDDGTGNKVFQIDNREGEGTSGFSFGADEWENYSVDYRIKYLENGYVGLQVRSDGLGFYIVNMGLGDLYLAYSTPTEWVRMTTKLPPIQTNAWHTVRVAVEGEAIKVFIDDNQWIDEQDSRYKKGWLLMFAESGAHAQIDDIHVIETK